MREVGSERSHGHMPKFAPGTSGNPAGRPRVGRSLAEVIRGLAGQNGRVYAETLHRIAMDEAESTKVRLDALRILLTRGFGNPPEEVRLETSNEVMRADALRKVLREERLLEDSIQPLTNPRQPAAAMTPELRAWLDGSLGDTDSAA